MTNQFYIPPEEKLYKALLEWISAGRKLWTEFDQEGIAVPPTLKRALADVNQDSTSNQVRKIPLRPPDRPERPPIANDDWLWIEVREASLRTIVLAILNEGKAIPIKELINRVKEIFPDSNEGSIYNLCREKRIQRTDQGWTLKSGVEAPVFYKKYIWSPVNLLQKQDLAAFRRMAIRYLLATSPDGLQIMQVYRELKSAEWLKAPLSKDLIKADLFVMKDEKRVKQLGNSKKWTLVKNPKGQY